jgi:GNAT superfamily N-acetyltransferase
MMAAAERAGRPRTMNAHSVATILDNLAPGVDPDYQRRGISSRLTEHATEYMQRCGMTSWSSRPAAIPATHLRGRQTKPPASRCSRSPAISGCSGDIPARWPPEELNRYVHGRARPLSIIWKRTVNLASVS